MAPPRPSPLPGTDPEAPTGRDALAHPVEWLKAHPVVADALLAVLVAAVPVLTWVTGPPNPDDVPFRDPDAGLALAIVLASAPLAWRRRRPLVVLLITVLAGVVMGVRQYNVAILLLGELVALYTVAAHCGRTASRRVLLAFAVATGPLMLTAPTPEGHRITLGDVFVVYLLYGAAWLVGDNLQTRRANVAALQERAERAERDREAEARRAAEEERARIAREMHDVVAHSMSVMVVQAAGARKVIDGDRDRAAAALEQIESTGRQALTDMRSLLGVLRDGGGPGSEAAPPAREAREPQPSLARLDDLVEQWRRAGLPVSVRSRGQVRPLPPGIDLAAYRIVQEALTNVRRHAGPATAAVTLTYGDTEVEVEVADDGRGPSAAPRDEAGGPAGAAGHGLVGMRERAALYGGTVSAGPRPGGGFTVRAVLTVAPS